MSGLQWTNLRLEVVGLLAVIGESAMSAHSAIATATMWGLVPRLIPAPQALFRHSRPHRLPPLIQGVTVVGVCSGNAVKELGYFANILHGINQLPQYAVGSITIRHKAEQSSWHQPDAEKGSTNTEVKPAGAGILSPLLRIGFGIGAKKHIHLRSFGPVILLSLLGALASLGILVLAIVRGDGMAVVAILLLSATSSLVGLGNKWTLELPHRRAPKPVPNPNIMVCGRQGAFLYIDCTEDIARELYFGQEECKYMLGNRGFHVLAGASTFTLMAAVISMANCTLVLQYVLGIVYITMNGLYWLAALLPESCHWQLEATYVIEPNSLGRNDKDELKPGNMDKRMEKDLGLVEYKNFTDALVAAIDLAGGAKWVRFAGVAPRNAAWKDWLKEAERIWQTEEGEGQEELRKKWKEWNPSQQLAQRLGGFTKGISSSNVEMKGAGEYMYCPRLRNLLFRDPWSDDD
ncbi:hypothetical protein L211DRAFT_649056 [Terfezia boudieri ATCC MYA-4762]|uniref:Uncharacterized protein n=1 Tax=Terfezia boudieri ATCC MYA-4762 TaxID=1051890 RepID=A0A3N4LV06_9PEZI|nr:hypothetical protein L211DRAFT_649056 [Terfezia boudieri ATCC MYA-4762]